MHIANQKYSSVRWEQSYLLSLSGQDFGLNSTLHFEILHVAITRHGEELQQGSLSVKGYTCSLKSSCMRSRIKISSYRKCTTVYRL